MRKLHKTIVVIVGAVVFSTIAIQASDVLRNIDGNLAGLVIESESVCGEGALQVMLGTGSLCVDVYEASPSEECPVSSPLDATHTQTNINEVGCAAVTKSGVDPWRFVSLAQAQQLCARSGKRLPTNDEWYNLVLSMADQSSCVIDKKSASHTGSAQCVTQTGIHDMIGNVWEWIDAEVYDGHYNERPLPESGYVQVVDSDGVVVETNTSANADYGNDYATTNATGIRGMLRGGFYGSGEDAGMYAQNIAVPLDLRAIGVGFRCVKSL